MSRSNNDGFVQFWDRAFNIFFCAYSGRREINNFVQFWDGVYNEKPSYFSFVSGNYNLSPEDHRVQWGEKEAK